MMFETTKRRITFLSLILHFKGLKDQPSDLLKDRMFFFSIETILFP